MTSSYKYGINKKADTEAPTQKNPLVRFLNGYKQVVPSPLAHSLLLAAITYPALYYGIPALGKFMTKGVGSILGGDDQMELPDQRPGWAKYGVPLAGALFTGAVPLINYFDSTREGNNLLSWNAKNIPQPPVKETAESMAGFKKGGSYIAKKASLFGPAEYTPTVNFSTPFNPSAAINLIQNSPYVGSDPYARNLGTSIVTAINPISGHLPTLGNLYDSAQNKFDTKLSLGGMIGTGTKAIISAGLAGMFTDVVGTALGMPDKARNGLGRMAAIGTALHSILT